MFRRFTVHRDGRIHLKPTVARGAIFTPHNYGHSIN